MQELYEFISSSFFSSFIWFFDDVTAWNWFSMIVEIIIWIIAVIMLAISKSIFKFMMFFFHCIDLLSIFHLKHVNKTCLIDIQSLLHLHVVIVTLSTHLLCRNLLKSIFSICSCVSNALWNFTQSLYRCRCWWVTSDIKYWKWTALDFSLQITLHVYLIYFYMSVSYIIIFVH